MPAKRGERKEPNAKKNAADKSAHRKLAGCRNILYTAFYSLGGDT